MKKTADVIIIGGGINGCATAYYLAKRGIKDVLVLEADDSIGHGGSSRNGGGVRQSGRDVRELPYAMYAVNNMWPTLSEELGVDVEYYQRGNLRLGKTEAHLKKLETLASNARSVGLDMHVIDGKEVKEICPHLSDEVIGASWCPTDGHANPMKTTLAFYTRSLELGARYITGAKVKAIEKVKGKARKVILTTGEVFEGETIILAAGYESRFIARTVGIDVPMTKFFEECLVTEMQPHMFDIMLGTADADFYGYIPKLADAKIVRTWGGWCDLCFDGVPVIDRVDEVPGLILACGFTGHGFGTAPAVGLMLSQMVAGEDTIVDISSLSYDRFKSLK